MAEDQGNDYAAEAETLAERVDWARGSELTAALEELEAISAAAPAAAGAAALPALVRLLAKNDCGPEAAQRAVETLSRLVDGTKHGLDGAKNGALFLSDPKNFAVVLDVLEEAQQETYTIVVALELVASLHRDHAERLRRALLDTPAGAARLLDRISDPRDAVRNAAVQLWEKLTRPEAVESRSSDDLRLNCAFADVFAKCYACLDDVDGRDAQASRACVHLVANVLNGPSTIVHLFGDAAPDFGLSWLVALLDMPPLDVAALNEEEDEAIGSPATPRKRLEPEGARDARRLAAAALAVLRRFFRRCDDDAKRRAWAYEDLRLSVLALALTDDEGHVVDLECPPMYPAGLVQDPASEAWWASLTDEAVKAPSRDDVRAAALEVCSLNVRDDPQLCLALCDAKAPTDGASPSAFGVALGLAFEPRAFGPASLAASSLATTVWSDEGAAIAAVMFAVAPPPDAEGASAVELLLAAMEEEDAAAALALFRALLARSDAVRDLALRLRGGALFSSLLARAVTDENALALICRWLDGCSGACRQLVKDPDLVTALSAVEGPLRLKGLACLALGLTAAHFGAGDQGGWSSSTIATFVATTIGRALDALQADAEQAPRRRRDKGEAGDVFEADADLAAWVTTAADAARGVVTSRLVGSSDAARDSALQALQAEINELRARSAGGVDEGAAAATDVAAATDAALAERDAAIVALRAEVAALRGLDPAAIVVGAELLAMYSGDGNYYDVIVEAVTEAGCQVRFRDYGNSEEVPLQYLKARDGAGAATGVDERDAVIASLQQELAQRAPSDGEELATLRAELAVAGDAKARASFLEETVAGQADEIRRLSEARDAPAAFGAAPQDAAGLFGAPPADDGIVAALKQRVAELEGADDASEALAARVAEAAQLQRRVGALEAETTQAATALQEANQALERERSARKQNEARLLDASAQPVVDKQRRVRRKLRKQTSNFSQTMRELFDISDHLMGELQAHEEDDSGDEDERCLEAMQAQLPRAVESIVARKIGEATAPLEIKLREVEGGTARLELERDEAKKECDGAINDLADLEERLFGAEGRLKAAEAAAVSRQEAEELADADVVQALVQERDLLKEKVRELDEAPQKWEARLTQLEAELKEASTQRDAATDARAKLAEEAETAATEREALRDGLRRMAADADSGAAAGAAQAQLEALKAQHASENAEAVMEREASRAAASQKVAALEAELVTVRNGSDETRALRAKLESAEAQLADATEREAAADGAVAAAVDAEILRAENARLAAALATRTDDEGDALREKCAALEDRVRSAGADEERAAALAQERDALVAARDEALQRLAAGDADAGAQLAQAVAARDEALAAVSFARSAAEKERAEADARFEQELAKAESRYATLELEKKIDLATLQETVGARDQAIHDVKAVVAEFEALQRDTAGLAQERDALQASAETTATAHQELAATLADTQRRWREKCEALAIAEGAAKTALQDETRRRAALDRELDRAETESRTTVDALERRVQRVDRQAVQAEERSELERAALKAEVRKLRTRFKEADERCAALEATRKKSEGLVVRATQEASSLSERLQTVEAQIEERSRVIEQLKEDAQTWEARATAAEAAAPPHEERELEQEALEALRSTATEDAQARLMAERERDALVEELELVRAAHATEVADVRTACERDLAEAETATRRAADDARAVEERVAESERRCVGAEEASVALSRDVESERARAAAADALLAERDAALEALADEIDALKRNDPDIAVGAELSGKFAGDGNYYDVVVEAATEEGFRVLFTDYGNSEDVLREHLRPRDDTAALKQAEADALAKYAAAEARADRAEAALLENFDESESDAGDTLAEWRERCLRAEDACAVARSKASEAPVTPGSDLREKLEARERETVELHAKLADADSKWRAELEAREAAEAVRDELSEDLATRRGRSNTGALDELAADLDEAQETLEEEAARRRAAEAALAAKINADTSGQNRSEWSADLDRIRGAEARAEALGRELEDARLKAAALQAELDAPNELDALAGELRAEAAVATHLADLHPAPTGLPERFDDEWRQLEDEHNDLLALLAQQELEKTAMAELLTSSVGPEALVAVKDKARADCETRYGSYVDYAKEDMNALARAEQELEGFVAQAEGQAPPVM